jgi:NAD+ synthase
MKMKKENKTANDFNGREKEVLKIYTRLNTINQHKMVPIPVCEIPTNLK